MQTLRFPVFAGMATVAAILAWQALLVLGVGGEDFFGASIAHAGLILFAAVVGGVLVGAAAVFGGVRGAATVSLLLLTVGVTSVVVWSSIPEPGFSATEFRSASAAGDYEEMERQAYRAVEQDALVGLMAAEARAALGEPSRIGRRQWIWHVGMINDFMGPGDDGALYVKFDGSRVVAAKVDVSAF